MRRFALVLGLSGGLTFLTGCPPTYPKCNSDANCRDHNEVCVEGQCRECATDQNCKPGFVCQGNRCVPKGQCTRDADCPSGQKCLAGRCSTHECESDRDCPGGAKCLDNRCIVGGCRADTDCPTGEDCQAGRCTTKVSSERCSWQPIRFGFNEATLTPDAQSKLSDLADCMKKMNLKITLEGHADERGTEEYNLQLSNRRAAAVKKYLADMGVSSKQVDTVGYGKNRPVVRGHNEEAWAANRRVEFNRH